jgi:hypothetical protein
MTERCENRCKRRLEGKIDVVESISPDERDEMFALMGRHYENVQRASFEADLQEKRWVIRLVDHDSGVLYGFSTQMLLTAHVAGRPIGTLFSGDTIVDPQHWGSSALAIAWGKLAFSVIQQHPDEELYWFLISQGYRTYRFLPVYFREFYPRFDMPTPPRIQSVLDALGRQKYAEKYDDRRGIARASQQSYRMRAGLADVTRERLKDPHVRYFVDRNPDFLAGDELCCLAPLTVENFSRTAQRLIKSRRFAEQTTA